MTKKWNIFYLSILLFSSIIFSCSPTYVPSSKQRIIYSKAEPASAEMRYSPAKVAAPVKTASQADVRNTSARQEGNRAVFTYDLISNESNAEAEVEVALIVQGKYLKTSDLHLEGDFGKVLTGAGKTIYWNALQDFPRGFTEEIRWEIAVKSNQSYAAPPKAEQILNNETTPEKTLEKKVKKAKKAKKAVKPEESLPAPEKK